MSVCLFFVGFFFLVFVVVLIFFFVLVVLSFFRDLDVELGFAIFTLKLIIFGNIEFACTGWAERDFRLHGF